MTFIEAIFITDLSGNARQAIRHYAKEDNWDYVKILLEGYIEARKQSEIDYTQLDWLYSLIPDQTITKETIITKLFTINEVNNHLSKWFGEDWNNQSPSQVYAMVLDLLQGKNLI